MKRRAFLKVLAAAPPALMLPGVLACEYTPPEDPPPAWGEAKLQAVRLEVNTGGGWKPIPGFYKQASPPYDMGKDVFAFALEDQNDNATLRIRLA